ncbi:MAG: type II toxin-antitoxin system RelE/ParE family toxin [Moraxella sp.]|nr:type II toxin-antitoxin system RelE/ParE family toxin [Moraxella sp.]
MKNAVFLGDSLDNIREFPDPAKQDVGYQLDKVQHGQMPDDFKHMPSIGTGVVEIRTKDEHGIYRVIYTAKFADNVYILHAFTKKTQKTARADIMLAKDRLKQLIAHLAKE